MKRTFKTPGKHDVDLAVQRAQGKGDLSAKLQHGPHEPANPDGPMIGKPTAKGTADDAQAKLEAKAVHYTAQVLYEANINTAEEAMEKVFEILTSPEAVPDMVRIRASVALLTAARERWGK